jgi:hypothetical protein
MKIKTTVTEKDNSKEDAAHSFFKKGEAPGIKHIGIFE